MAYDHEEQEQLASLRAWWNRFGNLLTWLLIAVLACYAGWTGWKSYERKQAAQASQLYDELQKAVAAKDNGKVQRVTGDMTDKFGRTAYAPMSALAAARTAFEAKDLKAAKAHLQWVIDHGVDDNYKAVAKIRLAGILLDEKAYDDALKLLAGEFPEAFAGSVADRKGDILTAQNKIAEARSAYQQALEKESEKNPGRQLIQLKLDALGGAAAKTVG